MDLIVRYQEAGHIRACEHAFVRFVPNYSGESSFQVDCHKTSFVYQAAGRASEGRLFHGCPTPCHYYSSARMARVRDGAKKIWEVVVAKPIAGAWKAFTALSAPVQTLVAATVLVIVLGVFGPRFLYALMDLLRVLRG